MNDMEWIKNYFQDLFSSDATLGLNAWDDDGLFRGHYEGNEFVIVVNDSDAEPTCPRCGEILSFENELPDYTYVCEECDENFYEFEAIVPTYEIRIKRIC